MMIHFREAQPTVHENSQKIIMLRTAPAHFTGSLVVQPRWHTLQL